MNKLPKILLTLIVFLMLNGCASLYVTSTVGPGVQPHVRAQMVETEKRMAKERREVDKIHRQQKRRIERAQNQPKI